MIVMEAEELAETWPEAGITFSQVSEGVGLLTLNEMGKGLSEDSRIDVLSPP